MTRRIAITGASGFIGRHVASHFEQSGDQVVRIARPFEPARLASEFGSVDVVIHLAGVVSAVRDSAFFDGNVHATRIVARAARDAGVPLVHVSSLAAAGPAPATAPRREDDAPAPINAYGRTKLEGERILAGMDHLRWTTLRPGVVFGPGDRAMRPLFAYARRGVLPRVGHPSAAYTFIYIDDAVRAIAAAAGGPWAGEAIFIGHPHPVTTAELLDVIRTAVNPSAMLIPVPRPIVRVAALFGDVAGRVTGAPTTINSRRYAELYAAGFVCRVERMRDRLGLTAQIDLATGIRRAVAAWSTEGV